jgi:hypothetical protein
MSFKRMLLLVLALSFVVTCSGCGLSREDVIGSYYAQAQDGPGTLALDLRDDGTFTMYRTINWLESSPGITVYKAAGEDDVRSDSGKWSLTYAVLGSLSVNFDAVLFTGPLPLTRHDGLVCFDMRHDHNKEYWCKSK